LLRYDYILAIMNLEVKPFAWQKDRRAKKIAIAFWRGGSSLSEKAQGAMFIPR
jgi:hypothetical protein